MRRLAASPKLLVRRSVARAQRLPPDVVDRLAGDEDRVVHLFLSESCDDATPEVLLSVWSWWDGSFSFQGRPRSHPNFPKDGLLRLADKPNPRLSPAPLVRLLLDERTARSAAQNPGIPASVMRHMIEVAKRALAAPGK